MGKLRYTMIARVVWAALSCIDTVAAILSDPKWHCSVDGVKIDKLAADG